MKGWRWCLIWVVSLSGMAAEVSQSDMAAAQRMTQQAVQSASKAYEQLLPQVAVEPKIQAMDLSEMPRTNANLKQLQHWLNQAQASNLLAIKDSHKVQGILFVSFSMPEKSFKVILNRQPKLMVVAVLNWLFVD